MIETTSGIDVVLGGHNHIVLQPPKRVQDCSRYKDTDKDGKVRHFIALNGPEDPTNDKGYNCNTDADCTSGYCNGLTAALTLLHPHPALKAISEQASPVDQWMNDDDHRYGALRES